MTHLHSKIWLYLTKLAVTSIEEGHLVLGVRDADHVVVSSPTLSRGGARGLGTRLVDRKWYAMKGLPQTLLLVTFPLPPPDCLESVRLRVALHKR